MLTDKDRKFVKEGAEVAVVNTSGWNSRLCRPGKIEKVLKTQIVLEDGRRFKVSDHEQMGASKHYADRVVAVDDPMVAQIENEEIRRAAESRAFEAVSHWKSSKTDTARMREVIEKMQDLLDQSEPDEDEG